MSINYVDRSQRTNHYTTLPPHKDIVLKGCVKQWLVCFVSASATAGHVKISQEVPYGDFTIRINWLTSINSSLVVTSVFRFLSACPSSVGCVLYIQSRILLSVFYFSHFLESLLKCLNIRTVGEMTATPFVIFQLWKIKKNWHTATIPYWVMFCVYCHFSIECILLFYIFVHVFHSFYFYLVYFFVVLFICFMCYCTVVILYHL